MTARELRQALFQLPDPNAAVFFVLPSGRRLPPRPDIPMFSLFPAGQQLPIVAVTFSPQGLALVHCEESIELAIVADPSLTDTCATCGALLDLADAPLGPEFCPVCDRPPHRPMPRPRPRPSGNGNVH